VVSRGGPSSIDRDGVFPRQPTDQMNSSSTLGERIVASLRQAATGLRGDATFAPSPASTSSSKFSPVEFGKYASGVGVIEGPVDGGTALVSIA
jgi:hypothetical protein